MGMNPTRKPKPETITFKVDEDLAVALRGIPNRSQFIRSALASALDSVCPFCHGTGILTPGQRQHWDAFMSRHSRQECDHCQEPVLVCHGGSDSPPCSHLHSQEPDTHE